MKLYEAIILNKIHPDFMDYFLRNPCPTCGKFEVDVYEEYGPQIVKFVCTKCGTIRDIS